MQVDAFHKDRSDLIMLQGLLIMALVMGALNAGRS